MGKSASSAIRGSLPRRRKRSRQVAEKGGGRAGVVSELTRPFVPPEVHDLAIPAGKMRHFLRLEVSRSHPLEDQVARLARAAFAAQRRGHELSLRLSGEPVREPFRFAQAKLRRRPQEDGAGKY